MVKSNQTKTMTEIQEMKEALERIERTLLMIVPFRRLPRDLQQRAAELQGHHDARTQGSDEREDIALREFEKMAALSPAKRCNAKWPKSLIPAGARQREGLPGLWAGVNLPIVPLSGLINRCAARNAFKIGPGEISTHDNARASIKKLGLKVTTLHKLGLGGDAPVVIQPDFKMPGDPWKRVDDGAGQDDKGKPEEKKPNPMAWADKLAAEKRAGAGYREDDEDDVGEEEKPAKSKKKEPAPVWGGIEIGEKAPTLAERMKAKHEEELADGTYAAYAGETFEESECAQGIGTIPSRDEDLSTTMDDVDDDLIDDDDWGPDELDTRNPIKEQFEREAAEAAAREEEAERLMATGDYYRKNGVVTKKAGR